MGYNELFAKSFRYGMMFGKAVKPGDFVSVNVTNTDDIILAIKKAYNRSAVMIKFAEPCGSVKKQLAKKD